MEGEKSGEHSAARKMKSKLMEAWEWERLEGTAGKSTTGWKGRKEGGSLDMSPKGLSENVPRSGNSARCVRQICRCLRMPRRRFAAGRSVAFGR